MNITPKQKKSMLATLCFALPPVGLLIWMAKKNKDHETAETAIRWSIWGIVAAAAALVIPFVLEYNAVEKLTK
jgi:putative copper export protein